MTPKPGYAAGNILNMLVHLGADLTGYDFSGLSVWQAYLQGVEAQQINFTRTSFNNVRFAEVFGSVYSLAFSPNGKLLAAGTSDGAIRVWQVHDLKHILNLDGHIDWVRTITFTPDGNTLVSGSDDQGTAKL
jgi:WD40 repeat protein